METIEELEKEIIVKEKEDRTNWNDVDFEKLTILVTKFKTLKDVLKLIDEVNNMRKWATNDGLEYLKQKIQGK